MGSQNCWGLEIDPQELCVFPGVKPPLLTGVTLPLDNPAKFSIHSARPSEKAKWICMWKKYNFGWSKGLIHRIHGPVHIEHLPTYTSDIRGKGGISMSNCSPCWSTRKSCATKGDLSTGPISVVAAVVVNLFARCSCYCSIFPSCIIVILPISTNKETSTSTELSEDAKTAFRKSPGTELIMFKTANPRQNLVESTDRYWNLQLFLWPQQQPATFSILFPSFTVR